MVDKGTQYFLALAELRNFTRAAKKLYVTQPAFSRKIAELENRVGCQLFQRHTHPIELTEAGTVYLKWAKIIAGNYAQLEAAMERARRGVPDQLRIGYNGKSHLAYVDGVLRSLNETYPGITCTTKRGKPTMLEQMLRSGDLDCIFTNLPHALKRSWMRFITIRPGGLCVLIPNTHPLARNRKVSLSDLKDETYITYPREISPDAYDFELQAFHASGFLPPSVLSVEDIEEFSIMVANGKGYALMSQTSAEQMQSKEVKAIQVNNFETGFDLVFAWSESEKTNSITHICNSISRIASVVHPVQPAHL